MEEERKYPEYTAETLGTYQTGSTEPPKNHRLLITCLFALVIVLCSVVTVLGFLNVQLSRQLQKQEESSLCSISFTAPRQAGSRSTFACPMLGIEGVTVSSFWQSYQNLPQGVYVTRAGGEDGLLPGDILLQINNHPIPDWNAMTDRLAAFAPGDTIQVTVYRQGSQQQLRLQLSDKQE